MLFQYYESDPARLGSAAPPEPTDEEEGEEEYEVDAILKKRIKKGQVEYFVRWKFYNDTTWEPEENLQNVSQMIAEFEKKVKLTILLPDEDILCRPSHQFNLNWMFLMS